MLSPAPHRFGLVALTSAFALGGGTLLAGPGCAATDDAPESDAGAFEGIEAGRATCSVCVAEECTAPWALCLTDESCLAARRCAAAEGCDDVCVETCACSDPGGARYRAFAACNDARTCGAACAADCATTCAEGAPTTSVACAPAGDAGGSSDAASADAGEADAASADAGEVDAEPRPTADTCAACAAGKCGDAKRACALGSECASLLACVFECADEACADECGRLHATGKVAAVELATCTQAGCERECGL
ncbi:MAG: hypothetical protein KF894_05045 [Labilithrix sp.]|nr:hypothetical protein [Labilithrix sp.]